MGTKDGQGKASLKERMEVLVREEILQAVVEVAREEGFQRVTMSGIADRAGVAKGTLYLYFEDKRELVQAAVGFVLDPLVDELLSRMDSEIELPEPFLGIAETVLRYFEREQSFFELYAQQRYLAQTYAERLEDTHYRTIYEAMTGLVRRCVEEEKLHCEDPELAALFWVEGISGMISRQLLTGNQEAGESEAARFVQTFLYGAAGPARS